MDESDIQISVVIPAKNSAQYLVSCLESLRNQIFDSAQFEVVVVDNMSTDETSLIAEDYRCEVVKSDGKTAGAVRNQGAQIAKGHIIAFLDSDCIAPKDWLTHIHLGLTSSSVSIIGGTCVSPIEGTFVEKNWAPSTTRYEGPVNALPGANMALSKELFFALEGFREDLVSAEDDDLCGRAKQKGHRIASRKELAVIHLGYPKSLCQLFQKMIAHGETQLSAHGYLGDKIVFLTWSWVLLALSSPILVINGIGWWNLMIAFFIPPFLFSIARLRRTSFSEAIMLFPKTFLICFVALSGRAVGLIKEIVRRIQFRLRANYPD